MKVIIESEKDLQGWQFLDKGELEIEKVDGFKSIIKLQDGSNVIYVNVYTLQKALLNFP